MVLFVDHQRDLFGRSNRYPATSLALAVLPADQLPLDEELPIDRVGFLNIDVEGLNAELGRVDRLAQCSNDVPPFGGAGLGQEVEAVQVSGQSNARRNHDVAEVTPGFQPFAGRVEKVLDGHCDCSSPNWSRILAACS